MWILIKNGYIITGDKDKRQYDRADVLIKNDRIVQIGPDLARMPEANELDMEVIDASHAIVMPGLINAHMHSNESFEQGAYDNLPLDLWLLQCYTPFGFPILSERDHYLRAMVCAIESIRSGVTTVQDDVVYPPATPDAVDRAMQAYADSGLRAWVTTNLWDKPFLECLPSVKEIIPADLQEELNALPLLTAKEQIDLFKHHFNKWHGYGDRLRIILAPCGPQRCTVELLQQANELSDYHNIPIHTHILETKVQAVQSQEFYGKTMVEYLHDLGLLNRRTTLIHAIWVTDRDIGLLADHGCSIVHNPLSNLKLGSGVCPIRKYLDAGVNVALGTDGMTSSDTADLIEAIRVASLMHKIGTHNYEEWVSAEEVFKMATYGGARSGLMEKEIGSLEPGKKADIILLDRDHWGFIPLHNPVQQLAFAVTSEAVKTSIINGRIVMRNRRILTIDEDGLKEEITEASQRFVRDCMPEMRRGAKRLERYLRMMYFEATRQQVPTGHIPLRTPPLVSGSSREEM